MTDQTGPEAEERIFKLAVTRSANAPAGRADYAPDPAHGRLEASVWNFFLELGEANAGHGKRPRQDRYAWQMIRGLIDAYAREAQEAETHGIAPRLTAWRVEGTRVVIVVGPADQLMQATDDEINTMVRQALEGASEETPKPTQRRRPKPSRR